MHTIITIGRQYGSGGREVGQKLAAHYGINFYDNELLAKVAKESGFCQEIVQQQDERPTNSFLYNLVMDTYSFGFSNSAFSDMPISQKVFLAQYDTIKKIAKEEGACVIIGRCADYILKDRSDVLNVFIYAPMEARIRNVRQAVGCTREEAEKLIEENDRMYHARYKQITGTYRGDRHNRDILIDAELLGVERTADYLESLVKTLESEGKFDGE